MLIRTREREESAPFFLLALQIVATRRLEEYASPRCDCTAGPEELTLTLDSAAITAIYLRQVGTYTKLVLGLLIVLSITTILISPDPNDDILGVLHQQHVLTAQPTFVALLPVAVSIVAFAVPDESAEPLVSANLLDLVCIRLV